MVYTDLYKYLGTYLAVRKAIVDLDTKVQAAKKYDQPCSSYEEKQKRGLFILWCLENIDQYEDSNIDKVISIANRFSRNCETQTITQEEIEEFMLTDLGISLIYAYDAEFLIDENSAFILQQNGMFIVL
jgi:hypothetical protein